MFHTALGYNKDIDKQSADTDHFYTKSVVLLADAQNVINPSVLKNEVLREVALQKYVICIREEVTSCLNLLVQSDSSSQLI